MKRIAIVGGGIAGLSAAFDLETARQKGAPLEYALFERSSRLGGVLRTERAADGSLLEGGPDSFLTEKPWAAELCRELGLEGELIGSNDAERKTFVVLDGRLVPLPEGLQFMVPTRAWPILFSPLFSFSTKLHMAREWFARPHAARNDESAAEFVARHFGREMVERLADPLLAGVYGGEAEKLSARAVLPRFVEMEEKSGSLSRAMLRAKSARVGAPPPLFTSLRNGMQQMVEAITACLAPATLHVGACVSRVAQQESAWEVRLEGGESSRFDGVILALPAYAAAGLLAETDAALAAKLAEIGYSSSVTATLGYAAAAAEGAGCRLPAGFGFLVPRGQGRRMLACTFVQRKFPHRAPEGRWLLRVFLGGSADEDTILLNDGAIETVVRQELKEILGLGTTPEFVRIFRWPRSMAQYEVGHLERVREIERLRAQHSGLWLAGNAYSGIGVPDCVRSGREAARAAARA